MKLLVHARVPEGYLLRVHLDEAKPDWIAEWVWGPEPPQTPADPDFAGHVDDAPMRPMSDEEYRAMQVAEVKLLAEEELARRRAASEPEVFAENQEL